MFNIFTIFKKMSGVQNIVPILKKLINVHVLNFFGVSKNVPVSNIVHKFLKMFIFSNFVQEFQNMSASSNFVINLEKISNLKKRHDFKKNFLSFEKVIVFEIIVQKFGKCLCFLGHSIF